MLSVFFVVLVDCALISTMNLTSPVRNASVSAPSIPRIFVACSISSSFVYLCAILCSMLWYAAIRRPRLMRSRFSGLYIRL